jgi:Protein of unknown function (DUF2637)
VDALTSETTSSPTRVQTAGEQAAGMVVVALVVVLGLIGAVNSFARVAQAVEPSFGDLAWTVPVGVDIGIAVFTALDLVMARMGMRLAWLRLVPWALVGVTIYLNVSGEHTGVGAVAHAALPCLWVIAVEAGSHVVRVRVGLTQPGRGRRRLDRVRWSRWILAPFSTVRLWRRMILWETPSYTDALRRERDRLLVRTDLQDQWGRISWRWQAPRRQRVLYKLGELAPANTLPADEPTPALPPASSTKRTGKRSTSTTGRRNGTGGRRAPGVDELLMAGRRVAGELAAEGRSLTRRELVDRLRAEGLSVSNARAGELLAQLRAEPPSGNGAAERTPARPEPEAGPAEPVGVA